MERPASVFVCVWGVETDFFTFSVSLFSFSFSLLLSFRLSPRISLVSHLSPTPSLLDIGKSTAAQKGRTI